MSVSKCVLKQTKVDTENKSFSRPSLQCFASCRSTAVGGKCAAVDGNGHLKDDKHKKISIIYVRVTFIQLISTIWSCNCFM